MSVVPPLPKTFPSPWLYQSSPPGALAGSTAASAASAACASQDLLAALVLSECVYKKLEMPPQQLADTVGAFLADFPPDLVHLEALQLSRDDVTQK